MIFDSKMSIPVTTQKIKCICRKEDRVLPKNSQTREKESKPSENRIKDSDTESDDLGLFLPIVKTVGKFEERVEKLHMFCVREARIFQRQKELSKSRDEIQHSTESACTPVRS